MRGRSAALLATIIAGTAMVSFMAMDPGAAARSEPVERHLAVVTPPQTFADDAGVLGDAVSDAQGRLFALDVQRRAVLMVAAPGAGPVWVGRPGHGPGEFVAPVSLALDTAGHLLVLDPGAMRIEAYGTGATGTRRIGGLALPFPAEDMVVCEGKLFLLGSWNNHLIHEISPADARVLRSFAPDSLDADDLMAGYRSSGYLACGPGAALTFLPMLRPELTRFSILTGDQTGELVVPGYEAVQVERRADGGLMFRAREGRPHDRACSVVTLPDSTQLVQVGVLEAGASTRHEFSAVRSFLVSWAETSIREIQAPLPRIVAAAGDSVLVIETDPAPRVIAARILPIQQELPP